MAVVAVMAVIINIYISIIYVNICFHFLCFFLTLRVILLFFFFFFQEKVYSALNSGSH